MFHLAMLPLRRHVSPTIKFTVNPFPREVGRGKRGIHRAVSRTAPTRITTSEDVTGPTYLYTRNIARTGLPSGRAEASRL